MSELLSTLQSLTAHRHKAGYSRLCHPTAKQPLQSPFLPKWDRYVLPLPPPQFLTVNYLPFSIIYSTTFLLFTKTVELSITMLEAPTALNIGFPFHIKAASRKNLGCSEPSSKTKTSSCRCAPHPITTRQAGTPTLCPLMKENLGGSHTVFPHLLLEGNVLCSLLPPQWQAQCLVHSKHSINVCRMNESWMEGKDSEFTTPATTQSTCSPTFQQSTFRQ